MTPNRFGPHRNVCSPWVVPFGDTTTGLKTRTLPRCKPNTISKYQKTMIQGRRPIADDPKAITQLVYFGLWGHAYGMMAIREYLGTFWILSGCQGRNGRVVSTVGTKR